MEEVLRELANATCRSILELLAVEPSYPRRIAALLGISETDVARRLRRLERLGLVAGKWGRVGKNVKVYRLAVEEVAIRIGKTGLQVTLGAEAQPGVPPARWQGSPIPTPDPLVGRTKEAEALQGKDPVVLVLGLPGMGKTSLVAHFAQRAQEAGRAVFWRTLRGVESVAWLSNQVALFLAHQGDAALLAALESGLDPAMAGQATLEAMDRSGAVYVLDEAHRVEDPGLRHFLADAVARIRSAKLVVASREWVVHNPARPGLAVLRLEGLDDDAAVALLEKRGIAVDAALRPRLREEVGGHPLGLQLLAAAAAGPGLEALLDRIPEEGLETWLLEELQAGLADDEREALAHASLLRTTFSAGDLGAVSKRRAEPVLLRLRRRLLVHETRAGYSMHEVVQNFFYSRLEDKKSLHARAAAHYLGKGTVEGRLEAMHHFLCCGERGRVLELLEQNLDLREFDFVDAGYQRLYQSILDLFPRTEVGTARQWGLIQDEKGDLHLHAGRAAQALPLYEEAIACFHQADDRARFADAAWKAGLCLEELGRPTEALAWCSKALAGSKPVGTARQRIVELADRLREKPRPVPPRGTGLAGEAQPSSPGTPPAQAAVASPAKPERVRASPPAGRRKPTRP